MFTTIRIVLATALVTLLSLPLTLTAQEHQHGELTLTIYQNGVTLVRDAREVTLSAGTNQVSLFGLPQQLQFNSILPLLNGSVQSVRLDIQRPGFSSLMEHLVGSEVRLDHTDGASISGILVHFRNNLVIVEQTDGSRVILPGLDGYRISAREVPNPDAPFPRIDLDLNAERRGTQSLELYYLTHGLRWETEFTLEISEDERSAVFNGWNVLENRSDFAFNQARVHLIAGELNMGRGGSAPRNDMMMRAAVAESVAFDGGQEASSFFEFQRFTLPGRVSFSPNETVKRALIPQRMVPVTKRYRYASSDRRMELAQSGMVQVQFDIDNARDGALGMAIPSGLVRMFQHDGESLQLIGQDQIANTSVGGVLRLTTGMAFDVLVQENVMQQNRISDRIHEQTNALVLTNERSEAITVQVTRTVHTNQRITQSSLPYTMASAGQAVFEVAIPAGGSTALEFTLRTER
ncbi:MAG: hypothetical protein JJU41_05680 [Bacteroidetes bacterium]|nr:hypothetical protein [Bacteroidota bacterium]MCH8524505.1 hypothetical protein [Balneolales bacterium]